MIGSMDKQMQLGQDLYDLNAAALQKLAELNTEGMKKYMESSQAFGKKLTEAKSISGWMELQRDYGETLWSEATELAKSQVEICRETYEEATGMITSALKPPAAPKTSKRPAAKAA